MVAVVSVLDPADRARVLQLQEVWTTVSGSRPTIPLLPPHLSYHVADRYDLDRLLPRIRAIAAAAPPLTVRAEGVGLFTGDYPVIFLPVIRDARLSELHTALWQVAEAVAEGSSPYYHPDSWTPHITLAAGTMTADDIAEVMRVMAGHTLSFRFRLDSIACISDDERLPEHTARLGGVPSLAAQQG